MNKAQRTRRSFLRAVGAAAAALPCYKLLESSVVQAQGGELPLRFVGVYHPHGIAAELWNRRSGETDTDFDLTYDDCSLQPFDDPVAYGRSFKDKILIVEGVDHLSNANGHESAGTILTGSEIVGAKPGNASIDQFLAVERGLGASTRLASLVLGVGNDALEPGSCLSFGPGGAALPKIIDPVAAFETIFGGYVPTDDPAARARAMHERQMGQSVLDFAAADINRLYPRLAASEQQKLDQHLTSLRELEKRLPNVDGPSVVCNLPARPDATEFPKLKQYNGGEPYFDAVTDAQIELLASALACDITRFATLFMADLSYDGNPLGLPPNNHDAVAHIYDGSRDSNFGSAYAGTPSTWTPLARFNRYSYGKVARLLQRLSEYGVLDSTLVYAASDMGNPAGHSTSNVPTLLAGGVNGRFRMGRRIKLASDCPPDRYYCSDPTRAPNNRILVAIAQAFGEGIEAYGTQPDPALTQGALSELV
jgi:hypothetical protein